MTPPHQFKQYSARIGTAHAVVLAAIFSMFMLQIMLNCDFDLALLGSIAAYFTFATYAILGGSPRVAAMFVVFTATSDIITILPAKTILGQPIDSNIDNASQYFQILALSKFSIFLAAVTHRLIHPQSLVTKIRLTCNSILTPKLGNYCFVLVSWATAFAPDALFHNPFVLLVVTSIMALSPLVMYSAAKIKMAESKGKRTLSPVLVLISLKSIFDGFVSTNKAAVAMPCILYISICWSLKARIRPLTWAYLTFFLIFWAIVINPLFRDMRGKEDRSLRQTLEEIQLFCYGVWKGSASDFNVVQNSYSRSYFGNQIPVLDRLTFVSDADLLIQAVNENGPLGWESIGWYFTILPKSISGVPAQRIAGGDLLGKFAGILAENDNSTGIAFGYGPTAYAFAGIPGVLVINYLTFVPLFLIISGLFGRITDGPWSLFGWAFCINSLCEGNPGNIIPILTRNLPIATLTCIALALLQTQSSKLTKKILRH